MASIKRVPLQFVMATTRPSDAKLVAFVTRLTAKRTAKGLCAVVIHSWEDLRSLIEKHPSLQPMYAPHLPGGQLNQIQAQLLAMTEQQSALPKALAAEVASAHQPSLPDASKSSLNKLVSAQLDRIRELTLQGRTTDALAQLQTCQLGWDDFDSHQRYRWTTLIATCEWRRGDHERAAGLLEEALSYAPDEPKAHGNFIRSKLLRNQIDEALVSAAESLKRFPVAEPVWAAWGNARLMQGGPLSLDEFPQELRNGGDVRGIVAYACMRSGDYTAALEHSKASGKAQGWSFDTRLLALKASILLATQDRYLASSEQLAGATLAELAFARELFEPLADKLWANEDDDSVEDAALCLTFAAMLTGCAQEGAVIAETGLKRLPQSPELTRGLMQCLCALGEEDRAYRTGMTAVTFLDQEGLGLLAELASHRGDVATVDACLARATGQLKYSFRPSRWIALHRSGNLDALRTELPLKPEDARDVLELVVAAQLHRKLRNDALADGFLEAAETAVPSTTTVSSEALLVAQLLADFGRRTESLPYLERLVLPGFLTPQHEMLLETYVRLGARKKALMLLRGLPEGSLQNERIRHSAIHLCNDVRDWEELDRLAAVEVKAFPEKAQSWLLRLFTLQKLNKTEELQRLAKDVPLQLAGSIDQQYQLAGFEKVAGFSDRALARIYRNYRSHLGNVDAAGTFIIGLVLVGPQTEIETPTLAGPGAAVTLRRLTEERTVVIDLEEAQPLAADSEFTAPDDVLALALKGKRVGDEVMVAGESHTITALVPALKYLAERANKLLTGSVKRSRYATSVSLPIDQNGNYDFSNVIGKLSERRQFVEKVFRAYRAGHATLGVAAKLLGTHPVELITSWTAEVAGPLVMCQGRTDERDHATRLAATSSCVVTDVSTVCEFVALGMESVLTAFGRPLLPTSGLDGLRELIRRTSIDKSSGHIFEEGGEICFNEVTDKARQARIDFLRCVEKAVETCCDVVPAYGPDVLQSRATKLFRLLDSESSDALRLASEQRLPLLVLDGRLREVATNELGIDGFWPQIALVVALDRGVISPNDYQAAIFVALRMQRSHVTLAAPNLSWLTYQPQMFRTQIFPLLGQYLSSPSLDLPSAVGVCWQAMEESCVLGMTEGALRELSRFLFGALLDHPAAPGTLALALAHAQVQSALAGVDLSGKKPDVAMWKLQLISYVRGIVDSTVASAGTGNASLPVPRIECVYVGEPPFVRLKRA